MNVVEPNLAPGQFVTPTIRLVRVLGRGAMGSVWIAEHLGLHAEVVVKFMSAQFLEDADSRARFEREAALAAQARGPNVVQVFDHGVTASGIPYIAMELLEGEDLGRRITSDGKMDPLVFSGFLNQVAKGLSRAHKNNVIHRDIKPENIFLCDNDGEIVVKILDFGVAKGDFGGEFHATRSNALVGTPYYMSPEQLMSARKIDARVDLWALGVVTYRALTGELPFDGDVIGKLIMSITAAPFELPTVHNPTLPPSVNTWMAKALAKDPADRFQTAKEMADAFAEAVGARRVFGSGAGFGDDASNPAITPPPRVATASAPPLGSTINATVTESAPSARARRRSTIVVGGFVSVGVVLLGAVTMLLLTSGRHAPREVAPATTVAPIPSIVADGAASTIVTPPANAPESAVSASPIATASASPVASAPGPAVTVATPAAEPSGEKPRPSPRPRARTRPEGPPPAASARPKPPTNPIDMPLQ